MFQIDNEAVNKAAEEIMRQEMRKKAEEIARKTLFWDMKELCRQVRLCETTVKEAFFYDPDFPKFRVGKKWLINAKMAEQFLIEWASRQPSH